MATITITEILGNDNIAGSRVTINDNFKKVANAINTLETYLDTSFVPGAALNVGSALIKKYTRPITDQIFTCEATGLFGGNLNVGQDLGVTRDFTVSRNQTVHGNFTLDGTVGISSVFTSKIPFSQDSAIISPQLNASITASNRLIVDPQALAGPSSTATARNIPTTASFNKVSVIRLNWANYTGLTTFNCNEIILPQVTDPNVAAGQIITLVVDAAVTAAVPGVELKLSTTNLDLAYTAVKFNSVAAASFTTPVLAQANDPRIRQAAITLYADNNGWRILSSVGTTVVIS
jgi:hypothetical protein